MTEPPISTPCIKTCAVSGRTGLCVACGRTLAEIAAWGGMEEAQRQAIMAELPARLAQVPDQMNDGYLAPLAYALMALVLVGGSALAASRRAKAVGAKGPCAIVSLLIWVGLIALVAVIYFGAQVWGGLFSAIS